MMTEYDFVTWLRGYAEAVDMRGEVVSPDLGAVLTKLRQVYNGGWDPQEPDLDLDSDYFMNPENRHDAKRQSFYDDPPTDAQIRNDRDYYGLKWSEDLSAKEIVDSPLGQWRSRAPTDEELFIRPTDEELMADKDRGPGRALYWAGDRL